MFPEATTEPGNDEVRTRPCDNAVLNWDAVRVVLTPVTPVIVADLKVAAPGFRAVAAVGFDIRVFCPAVTTDAGVGVPRATPVFVPVRGRFGTTCNPAPAAPLAANRTAEVFAATIADAVLQRAAEVGFWFNWIAEDAGILTVTGKLFGPAPVTTVPDCCNC